MTEELHTIRRKIRRLIWAGCGTLALLLGGTAGWATLARIDGAVIGQGALVVEGQLKALQHPAGGRITEILVAEGDLVTQGQVVIRLDATRVRADLAVTDARIGALHLRIARLEAELAGQDWQPGPGAEAAEEAALFQARRDRQDGLRQQIGDQIRRLEESRRGLEADHAAQAGTLDLLRAELAGLETLAAKGLVTASRIYTLRRGVADAEGVLAQIAAQLAALEAQIAEATTRHDQVARDARSEAAASLREAQATLAELTGRRTALVAEREATEIRAPVAGYVHQLAVHTDGGVIAPGAVMAKIVPQDAVLVAELVIPPSEIDRIHPGAPVQLRLQAGNQRLASVIEGEVADLGRDAVTDPDTGISHYRLRARLPQGAAKAAGVTLVDGMPVQGFVSTGSHSPAEWLLSPLTEQIVHAWRER